MCVHTQHDLLPATCYLLPATCYVTNVKPLTEAGHTGSNLQLNIHEQTSLSSNRRFEKICDLFPSILHNFGISKNDILKLHNEYWARNQDNLVVGYFIEHRS